MIHAAVRRGWFAMSNRLQLEILTNAESFVHSDLRTRTERLATAEIH
jgi:hypothetical protein